MHNNTENTTQHQQLLNELLTYADADEWRDDAANVFYGYLASEYADEQRLRQRLNEYQFRLLHFFTKLSELKKSKNSHE